MKLCNEMNENNLDKNAGSAFVKYGSEEHKDMLARGLDLPPLTGKAKPNGLIGKFLGYERWKEKRNVKEYLIGRDGSPHVTIWPFPRIRLSRTFILVGAGIIFLTITNLLLIHFIFGW